MSGETWAAIIAGIAAVVAAFVAAWSSSKASKRTADAQTAAAVIGQWSEIVEALQTEREQLRRELAEERKAHEDEIRRHVEELARCAGTIAECEKRCRECHADRQELVASLRALGELVTEEVTKSAVATVLEDNVDAVDDAIELAAIRAFLREARRRQ